CERWIEKAGELGETNGVGGINEVGRDTNQARAKTEGKYSFGHARRKGNDSLRARRFCCGDMTAVQDDQPRNKRINEDLLPFHRVHRANKPMTEVSLNSPTAPKVSPVMPPRRR